jgi:hypothetical protein
LGLDALRLVLYGEAMLPFNASKQFGILTLLGLSLVSSAAWSAGPLSSLDGLPTAPDVEEFLQVASQLDLADPRLEFADGSGGMSINLEYKGMGLMGDFLSVNADGKGDNSAGNPEGQIVAYNLSRILGYSRSYGRGRWHRISGYPVQVLRGLAERNTSSRHAVQEARERLLSTTSQALVEGTLSLYGPKPYGLSALEASGGPNGLFNEASPFASYLQSYGAHPENRIVTLGRYPVNELEAARTLSTIFVIDALTEQWDRFSGGNISVVKDGTLYRLVAYDNGGAGIGGWGSGYQNRYLGWTSRFDRNVVREVLAMDDFMAGRSSSFLGFRNQSDFLKTLGIRRFERGFRKGVSKVAAHMRATLAREGQDAYFE